MSVSMEMPQEKAGPRAADTGKNQITDYPSPSTDPVQVWRERLEGVKNTGPDSFEARCPVATHGKGQGDKNPSLSVRRGDDGRVLVRCHAGCSVDEITRAIGLTTASLFPAGDYGTATRASTQTAKKKSFKSIDTAIAWWLRKDKLRGAKVTVYDYPDGFRVLRFDFEDGRDKTFRPMHWTDSGLMIGDPKGKLPLYGRDEIGNAKTVHVYEGEKAADAARAIGQVAVTSAHGCKSPNKTDWSCLAGLNIVIFPDADGPGRKYAEAVATILKRLGCRVKIVDLPDLPEGGDIADFIDAHDSRDTEDIRSMIETIVSETSSGPNAYETEFSLEPAQAQSAGQTRTEDFRFTEGGFAQLFVEQHAQSVRFVRERGWLFWDRTRWASDSLGRVQELVKDTIRREFEALRFIEDRKKRTVRFKQVQRLDNSRAFKGILKLAESNPLVRISIEALDSRPLLLNCLNGTYMLESSNIRGHTREDLLTKVADVDFVEDVQAPGWEKFLNEIFDGDQELIAFIQRVCGYCLTGLTTEQCLFLLYGTGANGKSVFLKVIQTILGNYARQASPETFMTRRNEGPRNDVARLAGARFVASVEVEEGRRMAESLVKQLTGGDRITARYLFKEHFEYVPEFKLLIAANHKPVIRGTDRAIWRRIRLVPFTVTIPDDKQNPHLADELLKERSGILNWMLAGCRAWQNNGLQQPASVMDATAEYRAEEDTIRNFVEECCCTGGQGQPALSKDLLAAYETHTGDRRLKQRGLVNRLKKLGFTLGPRGTGGRQVWDDLRLPDDLK